MGGGEPPCRASRLWGAPPAPTRTGSDRSLPLSGSQGRRGTRPAQTLPAGAPTPASPRPPPAAPTCPPLPEAACGPGLAGVCLCSRPSACLRRGGVCRVHRLGLRHAGKPLSGVRFSGATGSPTVGENLVSHARWAHTARATRSVAVRTVGWPLLKAAAGQPDTHTAFSAEAHGTADRREPTALCAHEEAVAGSGVRLGNGFSTTMSHSSGYGNASED